MIRSNTNNYLDYSANIICGISLARTTWIGKRPTFAQQLRLLERVKGHFQAGKVLDIESLIQLGIEGRAGLSFDARTDSLVLESHLKQFVTKSTDDELELLKTGKRIIRSCEMMEIIIHGNDGLSFSSQIIAGSSYSISSIESINITIQNLLNELMNLGGSLKKIELLHTHPTVDVIFGSKDRLIYLINGLSRVDIITAKQLSKMANCELLIKAISGSGVTYSALITSQGPY